MEELSDEEIDATQLIVASPPKIARRRKKEVELVRTIAGWFRLQHTRSAKCENPDCTDPRPKPKDNHPVLMVYEMPDGAKVCRYCYLGGYCD